MEEPAPALSIDEYRRGVFRAMERSRIRTTYEAITLACLLWTIASVTCALMCAVHGAKLFGIAGGIAGGLLGLVAVNAVSAGVDRWWVKRLFRKTKRSSDDELWAMVNEPFGWTLHTTLALAQLAERDHDVSGALPQLRKALTSSIVGFRVNAYHAMGLMFPDEFERLGDWNPRAPRGGG